MKKVGRPSKKDKIEEDRYGAYFKPQIRYNEEGEKMEYNKPRYVSFIPKDDDETNKHFPIKIRKTNSPLNGVRCIETVDKTLLEKLIFSNVINTLTVHYSSKQIWSNLKKQLSAYREKMVGNEKKVFYNIPSKSLEYGRVSPDKSLSLSTFKREIRHALCKGYWIDIDIESAQPTLLYQFCKAQEIPCKNIEDYVLNRDKYFEEVANTYSLLNGEKLNVRLENGKYKYRDSLKQLFIIFMFFGGFDSWKNGNKIDRNASMNDCKLLKDFYQELQRISNTIMFHNKEFFNLVNGEEHTKTKKNDEGISIEYENDMGRAMSIFLQDLERKVLDVIYTHFKDEGLIVNDECVLCFDGIMIPAKYWKDEKKIFKKLKKVVKEKTGFDLTFTTKEFEDGNFILDSLKKNEEMPLKAFDKFDKEWFNTLQTYSDKKEYFEKFFCKVRSDNLILQRYFTSSKYDNDNKEQREVSTYLFSTDKFPTVWNDLRFTTYNIKTEEEEQASFTEEWLKDENILVSQNLTFTPMNKSESQMLEHKYEGEYKANLFTGYSDMIHTPFKKNTNINAFLKLVKSLCGGNQKDADYWINLKAFKIQYPAKKIPIGVLMCGPQGTGKNLINDTIGRLIGQRHYICSSKISDFLGEHGEGTCNKLLVVMNEVEGKDVLDFQGRLKELITEDKTIINIKFLRPVKVDNYALYTLLTNKDNQITIDVRSGDRRWFVIKSTSEYLDKKKYGSKFWERLSNIFKSPEFIAELYDFLNTRDLSNFDPVRDRPITEAYKQICRLSIPKEALFVEHLYLNELEKGHDMKKIKIYRGQELYDLSTSFNIQNGLSREGQQQSIKHFYSSILTLDVGIVKIRDIIRNQIELHIDFEEVMKKMTEKKFTDIFDDKDINERKNELLEEEGTAIDEFFNYGHDEEIEELPLLTD